MKCQNLFYGGKIRQNVINLSSAELTQRVVKVQLDPEFDQVHVLSFTLI